MALFPRKCRTPARDLHQLKVSCSPPHLHKVSLAAPPPIPGTPSLNTHRVPPLTPPPSDLTPSTWSSACLLNPHAQRKPSSGSVQDAPCTLWAPFLPSFPPPPPIVHVRLAPCLRLLRGQCNSGRRQCHGWPCIVWRGGHFSQDFSPARRSLPGTELSRGSELPGTVTCATGSHAGRHTRRSHCQAASAHPRGLGRGSNDLPRVWARKLCLHPSPSPAGSKLTGLPFRVTPSKGPAQSAAHPEPQTPWAQ